MGLPGGRKWEAGEVNEPVESDCRSKSDVGTGVEVSGEGQVTKTGVITGHMQEGGTV